jgi:hypothetical protein
MKVSIRVAENFKKEAKPLLKNIDPSRMNLLH